MSMTLTSIGASSSRIQATAHRGTLRAIPLHPRSSAFHTTSAPRDEAAAKKKKQGWTVQEVDGQLATMRRQQAQLKKAGQIDMYTFNVPIMGEFFLSDEGRTGRYRQAVGLMCGDA